MTSQLCEKCNAIFTNEQVLREDRPHHQSREGILLAAEEGCRLCRLITQSQAFEHFDDVQPFKANWYLSRPKSAASGKARLRLTIDAGWDEEDDASESLDSKNVDSQGFVRLPVTGNEVKGPDKSGFAPIWGFDIVPASGKVTCTLDDVQMSAHSDETSDIPGSDRSYRPPAHLGEPRSWLPVHRWLADCLKTHSRCSEAADDAYRPTRLVEVVDKQTVRLVEHVDRANCPCYASFSHCWGQAETLKLLQKNKQQLQTGIEIAGLPASYREAIDVAVGFDIRFIWIDSLCIIQDSVEDWRREASVMCDVYRNALLNISACAAAENSERSFQNRDHTTISPVEIVPSWHGLRSGRCFVANTDTWAQEVEESPLYRRSWVLQEARLSTRNLCLTRNQLWWGCRGASHCEAWPDGLPREMDKAKGHERARTAENTFEHFQWCDLVEKYTTCGLTVLSDRMMAIAGLATAYREDFPDDEYVAGLWRSQLPQSLCWVAGPVEMVPMKFRPLDYRAPSWSWASVEGGVYFHHTRYGPDGAKPASVCDVLGVEQAHVGPSAYGQLAGGSIDVRGKLSAVRIGDNALLFPGTDDDFRHIPGTAEEQGEERWDDNHWTSVVLDEYTSYVQPVISTIDTSTVDFSTDQSLAGKRRTTKLAEVWDGSHGELLCLPVIEWDRTERCEGAGLILAHAKDEPSGRYQRVGSFRWNGSRVRDHLRGLTAANFMIV